MHNSAEQLHLVLCYLQFRLNQNRTSVLDYDQWYAMIITLVLCTRYGHTNFVTKLIYSKSSSSSLLLITTFAHQNSDFRQRWNQAR